jgi:GT2 family glycosyltransferase
MPDLLFSVIIPVLNNWELTRNCLESLHEHSGECRSAFEVIVVDNASSDATATELQGLGETLFGKNFQVLRFAENRNFGPACNAGAAAAKAPFLFFLNNDTLLTPGWTPPLLTALDADPALGAVGPLLLYENNTVQHLGVAFTLNTVSHLYRTFPADHPAVGRPRSLQALTAAALMLPRSLFLEAGSFCADYRNGFEDVDLCLQLRSRFGKKLACIVKSVVYHLESRTEGRKDADDQNVKLLTARCWDIFKADLHTFGLQDGFEPFISDNYGICLRLRQEEEDALSAKANGKPPDFWFSLLLQNPLWREGHRHLIAALEKAGQGREAVPLFLELCIIERNAEVFREGALFAARHADEEKSAYMAMRSDELARSRKNRARAYGLLRTAKAQDPILLKLYEAKIRECFVTRSAG